MSTAAVTPNEIGALVAANGRLQRELDEHALERRQEALFTLAKRAIHDPADLQPLLLEAAAIVAEALETTCGGYAEPAMDAWTLRLVSAGARPVKSLAECSLPAEAHDSFARHAVQAMNAQACDDLLVETRFADAFLLEQGVRSGVMCPLLNHNDVPGKHIVVLGVLAVLDHEARNFTASDLRFMETVAQWLTLIVARVQTEHKLEQARLFAATLTRTIDALVVELDPQGQIQWVNPACEAITGFLPDELNERTLWNALLIPDEVSLVKEVFARLKTEAGSLDFDSHVLTKHGERRRMAWSCSAIRDGQGNIHSILATGLDVTDKLRAELELKKLRQAASTAPAASEPTSTPANKSPACAVNETQPRRAAVPTDRLLTDASASPPATSPLVGSVVKERRARPRCAYPYKQLVAPLIDGRLPPKSLFLEVQCREIAASGFSYLAPSPPGHEMLVVSFGVAPSLIYLSAKIQHVTRTKVNGIVMFMVGCQYVERVTYNGR